MASPVNKCRLTPISHTTNDAAVRNTWSLFTSNGGAANINAWNPKSGAYDRPLYYYKQSVPATSVVTPSTLLASSDGNGECYAFGQLFQDALWANGISSVGTIVTANRSRPPEDFW
jgi:hypothetical protein